MAAGLGFKTFTTGEVLTAADTNGYLMQGVLVFASSAARAAAVTSPQEGQYSYLKDTNSTEYYDGAAWIAAPIGDITGVTAGTGISGGGTSGTVTVTNDMATTITAAGDIVVGTGSGTYDNLPIGTTAQVLTADTTVSPYKVKWATASSGGMTLLSTTAVSGTSTTVSSIDQTYTNLMIVVNNYKFGTGAAYPTFNVGVGNNNYMVNVTGNGYYSANVFGSAPNGNIFVTYDNVVKNAEPVSFALLLPRYTTADTVKTMSWQGVFYNNGVSDLRGFSGGGGSVSTTAISSFTLTNHLSYTASSGNIYIYGVK
jgi:hypothetical protein